jgi:uncharacterized coiled-coil DUF342 family protein
MDNPKSLAKKFNKSMEIVELKAQLEEAQATIQELRNALASRPMNVAIEAKSSEELICETEIEKLRYLSQQRALTPPETKQFEIYVKSLALIRGNLPKTFDGSVREAEKMAEAELIELAKLS